MSGCSRLRDVPGDDGVLGARLAVHANLVETDIGLSLREEAARAEVEPVDASAQMLAAGFHAVPGEHADAIPATPILAHALDRLDLTFVPWKREKKIPI